MNNMMGKIPLVIPPKYEQTTIADFLDRKTAQIDKLITNNQKLVELLKEERTAIIKKAVTHGINPNVKLKPSGLDWLGNIPVHWAVKKLKYVANIVLGKMLTNEDKGDYSLKPYLRAANLQWMDVKVLDVKEMWFSKDELAKLRVKIFDLLVSEGGEVGRTCIWREELVECYIQNSVHKITIEESQNPLYFLYLFFYLGSVGYFESIVNKISIAHLTGEKIREVFAWFPNREEQNQIIEYIETKTTRINSTITKIEKEIELLQEYRTALISEVVTGKIKVI
jgi:type I restriction enzyme S subunit